MPAECDHDWAAITRLEPAGLHTSASVLHLREQGGVRLPGVHGAHAHQLAGLVAQHTGHRPMAS